MSVSIYVITILLLSQLADHATTSKVEATSKDQHDDDMSFELVMEQLLEMDQSSDIVEQRKQINLSGRHGAGSSAFTCSVSLDSHTSPTSVHQLRPGNVKTIAALGDSLTAANGAGATSLAGVALNYRGIAWSIGGDETLSKVVTLPNILRKFSPNLYGYSEGICFRWQEKSRFNVAKAGAIAQDMPGQADLLVDTLKRSLSSDYYNDWKLITLFVGGNNLCRYCLNREKHKPENYVSSIKTALDTLHREVPRAFVNLVPTVDVTLVQDLSVGAGCAALHAIACPCGAYESFADKEEMATVTEAYRQGLQDLVDSGRYDSRSDFTVVIQPFLHSIDMPLDDNGNGDLSYFAPDCFHFSAKAHEVAGLSLWNSMLEPVGGKTTSMKPGEDQEIKCPTQDKPYLFTRMNSNMANAKSSGQAEVEEKSAKVKINSNVENVHHRAYATLSDDEGLSGKRADGIIVYSMVAISTVAIIAMVALVIYSKRRRDRKAKRDVENHTILSTQELEKY